MLNLIKTGDGSNSLLNTELNETYHSIHGALQESNHVFIKNGLQFFVEKNKTSPVSIFEVGFGTGLNALLALKFSLENRIKINYVSIEVFPIDWEMISQLNYGELISFGNGKSLFTEIHQSEWGKEIEINKSFSLTKIKQTIQSIELMAESFDVIFFDAFAPSKQPEMWEIPIFTKITKAMKPEAVFVTYCAKGQLKQDLKSLGMIVESLPGPPGKREMVRALKLKV